MLSDSVKKHIKLCFKQSEQPQVQSLLDIECSDALPMVNNDLILIERIQIAVIKQSQGKIDSLRNWVDEAQDDWGDVLDAAGFYKDSNAHLLWRP
jgi:hypothetical protein